MKKEFAEILEALKKDKEFGTGVFAGDDIHMKSVAKYGISSGIPELDLHLGQRGGLPAGKIIEYYGEPMVGKAESVHNNIRTPKGWKLMQDIEIGDTVCTPDGGIANVIATFPQGIRQLYELTLSDGRSIKIDGEHLWKVYSPRWKRRGSDGFKLLSTLDILNLISTTKTRIHLPLTESVFCYDKELTIHPYIMGALLGDGSFRQEGKLQFTCANPKLIDTLNRYVKQPYRFVHRYGLQYHLSSNYYSPNSYIQSLKYYDLWRKFSSDKFIPNDYLEGSIDQRWELLQGLMDTDGSCSKLGAFKYHTKSNRLANDVQMLIWSLGGRATKLINNRGEYRINICFSNRDKLSKVKQIIKPKVNRFTSNEIVSITKVEQGEAKCIMIDHPEQLYITQNYIVTHNTTAALQAAAEWQKRGGLVYFIDTEQSYSPKRSKEVGVKAQDVIKFEAETIEQAFAFMLKQVEMLEKVEFKEPVLFIVDSVTGVPTEADAEGNIDDSDRPGFEAKQIKRGVRKLNPWLTSLECRPSVIFINHVHSTFNSWGKKSASSGGKGIKFYGSVRVEFANLGQERDKSNKEKRIGQKINITIEKLKGGSLEYPNFSVVLYNATGFDRVGSLIEAMAETGYAKRPKGSHVTTVLADTDKQEQFKNTDVLDWVESKGGYDAVYAAWRKHAIETGYLLPWGGANG